jgi:ATP-dependent DNA helicase RecQ
MINGLLEIPSLFLLFIAPPGWGKTRMLLDLYKNCDFKIIFVSPLRALACEFYSATKSMNRIMIHSGSEKTDCYKKFIKSKKSLLIATPELLDDGFWDELEDQKEKVIVVIDEFHLFYYWGVSFRPKLLETCMAIASAGISILGLSATIDKEMQNEIRVDFENSLENRYVLDLGNQKLKNVPERMYWFPGFESSKKMFRRFALNEFNTDVEDTILYFCKYRKEVAQWVDLTMRLGINSLGCVGGEVNEFVKALKENPKPKVIFATSTLSHGVNLPTLSKIFIGYKVSNLDFWIQMVGRGGRSGEKFEIYNFDPFNSTPRERLLSFWKIIIYDMLNRFHIRNIKCLQKLKVYLFLKFLTKRGM